MNLANDTLAAFHAAAGVLPEKVSLLIRTVTLALMFLWAVWCIHGEINYCRHHDVQIYDVTRKLFRVLFIIVIAMILVFI